MEFLSPFLSADSHVLDCFAARPPELRGVGDWPPVSTWASTDHLLGCVLVGRWVLGFDKHKRWEK